jgi:hypothetical protein
LAMSKGEVGSVAAELDVAGYHHGAHGRGLEVK